MNLLPIFLYVNSLALIADPSSSIWMIEFIFLNRNHFHRKLYFLQRL